MAARFIYHGGKLSVEDNKELCDKWLAEDGARELSEKDAHNFLKTGILAAASTTPEPAFGTEKPTTTAQRKRKAAAADKSSDGE